MRRDDSDTKSAKFFPVALLAFISKSTTSELVA